MSPSYSEDFKQVLKQLDPHREVTTEDGHTGLLALDYTSVTVEAKGYQTNTRSLSATRTYPNLSDADLDLIPKTITDGGKTLTLGAVEWSGGENRFYTATARYTGTSSTRTATGYTVTASYTRQVAKTDCEVVTYMAIFGSVELTETDKNPEASGQPETPAPGADQDNGPHLLPILGCAGGVVTAAAVVFWVIQSKKGRRFRT